jgi:hypothetical protein
VHLPAEDEHHELPGTYTIGLPRSRPAPRIAIAGIVVFVVLVVAALVGAVWAGTALRG